MLTSLGGAGEAAACDANLDIDLKLQGSIVYDVINLFSKPISALIKHQANHPLRVTRISETLFLLRIVWSKKSTCVVTKLW